MRKPFVLFVEALAAIRTVTAYGGAEVEVANYAEKVDIAEKGALRKSVVGGTVMFFILSHVTYGGFWLGDSVKKQSWKHKCLLCMQMVRFWLGSWCDGISSRICSARSMSALPHLHWLWFAIQTPMWHTQCLDAGHRLVELRVSEKRQARCVTVAANNRGVGLRLWKVVTS